MRGDRDVLLRARAARRAGRAREPALEEDRLHEGQGRARVRRLRHGRGVLRRLRDAQGLLRRGARPDVRARQRLLRLRGEAAPAARAARAARPTASATRSASSSWRSTRCGGGWTSGSPAETRAPTPAPAQRRAAAKPAAPPVAFGRDERQTEEIAMKRTCDRGGAARSRRRCAGCRERGRPDPNIRMAISHDAHRQAAGAGRRRRAAATAPGRPDGPDAPRGPAGGRRRPTPGSGSRWKDKTNGKEGIDRRPARRRPPLPGSVARRARRRLPSGLHDGRRRDHVRRRRAAESRRAHHRLREGQGDLRRAGSSRGFPTSIRSRIRASRCSSRGESRRRRSDATKAARSASSSRVARTSASRRSSTGSSGGGGRSSTTCPG